MNLNPSLESVISGYDPGLPLERAWTIPGPYYTDPRVAELERRAVFGGSWQVVGRVDQLGAPGAFITATVGGEPIVVVRGEDGALRGFFNVCRHHAAAVATEAEGTCSALRCPYHGWTYGLDGSLRVTPDFDGVCDFDKGASGLAPVAVEAWENFVFVHLDPVAGRRMALREFLGGVVDHVAGLDLSKLHFFQRRSYTLNCNWKVYVDNYLDGGYHVPYLHKSLNTVIEYKDYQIECRERSVLQWSPMKQGKDAETAAVRRGEAAYYWWVYPNFMINWYEGVMDTNLVLPLGVDRCEVIFDFYFDRIAADTEERNRQSIAVGERVQQEDIDICEAVQRGLSSRAYVAGRLAVRREAGEHLFHRLLHADLSRASTSP